MTTTTTLKSIIGAVALTTIAGMASAATMSFGTINSDGIFNYTSVGPSVTFTDRDTTKATGEFSPYGAGADRSVERDFSLEYDFTASLTNSADIKKTSGTFYLGSFSINEMISAFQGAQSGATGSTGGFTFKVDSVSFPNSTTVAADGKVTLNAALTTSLRDALGFGAGAGEYSGKYSVTAKLVADVDVAPVPLPAAAPMLLAGIGGFVAFRRKRRQAA